MICKWGKHGDNLNSSHSYLAAFCSICSPMSLKICLNSKSPGSEFNRDCRSNELQEYSFKLSILWKKNKNKQVITNWGTGVGTVTLSCDVVPKAITSICRQWNRGVRQRFHKACWVSFLNVIIFTLVCGLKAAKCQTAQASCCFSHTWTMQSKPQHGSHSWGLAQLPLNTPSLSSQTWVLHPARSTWKSKQSSRSSPSIPLTTISLNSLRYMQRNSQRL